MSKSQQGPDNREWEGVGPGALPLLVSKGRISVSQVHSIDEFET